MAGGLSYFEMVRYKAKVPTVIKIRPEPTSILERDEMIVIPQGAEIEIEDVLSDRHHLSFVTYLDKKDVDYQPFERKCVSPHSQLAEWGRKAQ